jgi:hypothetical protein
MPATMIYPYFSSQVTKSLDQNSPFKRLPLAGPGHLQVGGGGSAEGGVRYQGRMNCAMFWDKPIDKDKRDDVKNMCKNLVLPATPLFRECATNAFYSNDFWLEKN